MLVMSNLDQAHARFVLGIVAAAPQIKSAHLVYLSAISVHALGRLTAGRFLSFLRKLMNSRAAHDARTAS
jgi:hypothetical protein